MKRERSSVYYRKLVGYVFTYIRKIPILRMERTPPPSFMENILARKIAGSGLGTVLLTYVVTLLLFVISGVVY